MKDLLLAILLGILVFGLFMWALSGFSVKKTITVQEVGIARIETTYVYKIKFLDGTLSSQESELKFSVGDTTYVWR